MARPKKKEQIRNISEIIKETAWNQIAAHGAAALSLRAIAREVGITAPAIYNYFFRRDDLVTALIVDAYLALADTQRDALQNQPEQDLETCFIALGVAYREWAVTYPQRYQLIFGTPIPHYHAPEEITQPAAVSALLPLLETFQALAAGDLLRLDCLSPLTPDLESMLVNWQQDAEGMDLEVIYASLVAWSRVHGLVSLEIGGHIPPYITDPGEVFRRELRTTAIQYIKQ
jgi:AcrR family transcriptional regulator